MSLIGKHHIDPVLAWDIRFHDASMRYLANVSWLSRSDDDTAPNRQYEGLVLQSAELSYSWFDGSSLGGRSKRNFGTLRLANPDDAHNFEDEITSDLSVQRQPIVHRVGCRRDHLSDMLAINLEGRAIRPSEDGSEVLIDLADKGQALDTSMFLGRDRLQGLGAFCVRFESGELGVIADAAALDPASAFYLHVAYRIPSWTATASGILLAARDATGGGYTYLIELRSNGKVRVQSRTSADATVTLDATDLDWVKDGRWHHVVAKWNGTVLKAFHSGDGLSAITAAQTTIKGSTAGLAFGDLATGLDAHGRVEIALVALATDANVPTDDEILARLNRGLTEDEGADCVAWINFVEGTGTTASDSASSNNATVPNDWHPTFEGPIELAGKAKPLAFGYAGANAEVFWTHRERGQGLLHARCIKGVYASMEGAYQFESVGWVKHKFYNVRFDAATDTISFDTREAPTGVERFEAQPGFSGPLSGQQVIVAGTGTANDGTWTLAADATIRSMQVTGSLTDHTGDAYITVLGPAGTEPRVTIWHEMGAVKLKQVPSLPATFGIEGDIGADTPQDSATLHWPHYTAAIMRRVLTGWAGETSISTNWDDGTTTPSNPIGAYWKEAGFWLDPDKSTAIRDVIDEGNNTLWARSGEDIDAGDWDLYVIDEPPSTGGIALTDAHLLELRRDRSVEPVGGFTLRGAINYRPLEEGEVLGIATEANREALRREHIEKSAVVDATVATKYPLAETPAAITTWLRHEADILEEAQRRYDILKVKREVYSIAVVLYGLGENLLNTRVQLTVATEQFAVKFPTLASGKDFWLVGWKLQGELVRMTLWG